MRPRHGHVQPSADRTARRPNLNRPEKRARASQTSNEAEMVSDSPPPFFVTVQRCSAYSESRGLRRLRWRFSLRRPVAEAATDRRSAPSNMRTAHLCLCAAEVSQIGALRETHSSPRAHCYRRDNARRCRPTLARCVRRADVATATATRLCVHPLPRTMGMPARARAHNLPVQILLGDAGMRTCPSSAFEGADNGPRCDAAATHPPSAVSDQS